MRTRKYRYLKIYVQRSLVARKNKKFVTKALYMGVCYLISIKQITIEGVITKNDMRWKPNEC